MNDILNVATHGIGYLIFLVMGSVLYNGKLEHKRDYDWITMFVVAGLSMLGISTINHAAPLFGYSDAWSDVFQRLDRVAIFVMIASTFSVIHGLMFDGWLKGTFLKYYWGLVAIMCMISVTFLSVIPSTGWLVIFLSLGWVGLFSGYFMVKHHGWSSTVLILLGGIQYSVGTLFYDISHPIFHVYVLLGLTCHWAFLLEVTQGKYHENQG